jgi:dihydroorotase
MGSSSISKIAIINGKVFIDDSFKYKTVLINADKIIKVIDNDDIGKVDLYDYRVIDAKDCYVSYGFFDPHVHFRTPGFEYKEDWDTGSMAAINGGYTFVCDMPNTNPAGIKTKYLVKKNNIIKNTILNYGLYLGLTDKNSGKIKNIYKRCIKNNIPILGIKAFLGSSTGDLLVRKKRSIHNSLKTGIINLFHAEDEEELKKYENLEYKTILDHNKKRPPIAAIKAIKKIIKSAKKSKGRSKIYICHLSTRAEVELVKKYRLKGFNIITEVTPHHLYFYEEKLIDSSIYKVNPPIRKMEDVMTLRKAFNDGFFDIIGTDHAPHLLKEKESQNPPSGIPGLESSFYVLYSLFQQGILSLEMIFKLLTSGYKIFKIKKRGNLKKNNFADITIIKKINNIFKSSDSFTKSDFSPYDGLETNCKIDTVIINGRILLQNGKIIGNTNYDNSLDDARD